MCLFLHICTDSALGRMFHTRVDSTHVQGSLPTALRASLDSPLQCCPPLQSDGSASSDSSPLLQVLKRVSQISPSDADKTCTFLPNASTFLVSLPVAVGLPQQGKEKMHSRTRAELIGRDWWLTDRVTCHRTQRCSRGMADDDIVSASCFQVQGKKW